MSEWNYCLATSETSSVTTYLPETINWRERERERERMNHKGMRWRWLIERESRDKLVAKLEKECMYINRGVYRVNLFLTFLLVFGLPRINMDGWMMNVLLLFVLLV